MRYAVVKYCANAFVIGVFHSISQACDVGYMHVSIKILSYTMVCEQRYKMHEASLFKTPTSVAINTLQLRGEYMLRGQENT